MTSYRMEKIYLLLLNRKKIAVTELAEIFQVTPTTIRRDLLSMEEKGVARRTRGYALACDDTERSMELDIFVDEKMRIAEAAKTFVKNRMSLALDAGRTVQTIAEALIETSNITGLDIVTNSLPIALKLSNHFSVSMPGGTVLPQSAVLLGVDTESFFSSVNVDIAFLGTTGIDGCNGLTVSYPLHLSIKRHIVASASKTIAVLDSSKFFGRGIFTFCEFAKLDMMITVKTSENEHKLREIEKQGVELILV